MYIHMFISTCTFDIRLIHISMRNMPATAFSEIHWTCTCERVLALNIS